MSKLVWIRKPNNLQYRIWEQENIFFKHAFKLFNPFVLQVYLLVQFHVWKMYRYVDNFMKDRENMSSRLLPLRMVHYLIKI